jgi:thiol-disulfide isomerase/thioredoxin
MRVLVMLSLPLQLHGGELIALQRAVPVELALSDIDGRTRSLAEFRGRVTLINFWASWCPPCLQEMPALLRLQQMMQGKPFAILGINVAEGIRRVRTVASQLDLTFAVLLDPDSRAFRQLGAEVLPSSYILDGDGIIRFAVFGAVDWDSDAIQDTLETLLPAPSSIPVSARNALQH